MTSDKINNDIQTAINFAKRGKITQSKSILEKLLKKNKNNINILVVLADLYGKTGDIKGAIQNYKKVIQKHPGHKLAHINMAMLYHGSGRLQKAEQLYRRSLKLDNHLPIVNFNLGLVLQEQGKLKDAQQKYLKAISLDPLYTKAYANLAYIQLQFNQLDESIGNCRKALELAPNVPEIHNSLGVSLLRKGLLDEAEQCQRKALQLRPDYSDAWESLGAIYLYKDKAEMAVDYYNRALVSNPHNITALCGLAKTLSDQGLHKQAFDKMEQALLMYPDHIEVRLTQGYIFIAVGKLGEALECCEYIFKQARNDKSALLLAASIYEKKAQAEESYACLEPLLLDPSSNIEAVLCFASISKSLCRVDDAISMMENILESNSLLSSRYRRHLCFSLGKAHDSLKNYDKAFHNYRLGNKLKKSDFSITAFRDMIDRYIKVFNSDFLATHALKPSTETPVFIVGMPRSGTSLVEQVLSSHPQVFGAGELDNIHDITTTAAMVLHSDKKYPECLKEADEADLLGFARSYIDSIDCFDSDALRITDKMPSNFLHIGLIRTLFPKAHIIHCMRDPLDTCLSVYFQDFGINHPWIYDLENIANVYNEYLRMMDYWQNELGIPIHRVRYEELVEDQEKTSKRLINYIGLDWDEQCIRFHENERFIWTASYDQVRQPLYTKSIMRWKHYKQHLSQIINIIK